MKTGGCDFHQTTGDCGCPEWRAHDIVDTTTVRANLAITSIDRWLATKPVIIWGQGFDISDDRRRRAAAEWLYRQMKDWMDRGETVDE